MTTAFVATAQAEEFNGFHFSQQIFVFSDSSLVHERLIEADPNEPYDGFLEEFTSSARASALFSQLSDQADAIARSFPPVGNSFDYFELFEDTSVDYSFSNAAVHIDLNAAFQQGGFAQGDELNNVFEIIGSGFDDTIRGSSPSAFPPDSTPVLVNGHFGGLRLFFTLNIPSDNVLNGGAGNDLLEGRGGADVLNGGIGFDIASYELSPTAVTVRLPGVGFDTQTAIATGGDAAGDTFSSIEGLAGSRFDDHLTGNSLNNVFVGGLGNDTFDGKAGSDTADYSQDHVFAFVPTADRVVVRLGLAGAVGSAVEFKALVGGFQQLSVDTLISIENVTGTNGPDTITGNEQENTLDGRGSDDTLDGGFGNDTLIGGSGRNTVSYASHDGSTPIGEVNIISLGLNGADGSFTRSEFSRFGSNFVELDVLRGIDNVTGSNRNETINGNEHDNVLAGRGGNDIVNGGAGNDTYDFSGPSGSAQGGDQYFDASGAADKVRVNSFADIVAAQHVGNDLLVTMTTGSFRIIDHFAGHAIESIVDINGNSMVLATGNIGGSGGGIIAGGNSGEILDGGGGDDFLFGGNGSDRIIGGDGNDQLSGGNGGDTFVFGPAFGHDAITDFSHADRVEFDGGVFLNFQAVQAAAHQMGANTVITLDDNNSITLQGIDLHNLHASDFFFV